MDSVYAFNGLFHHDMNLITSRRNQLPWKSANRELQLKLSWCWDDDGIKLNPYSWNPCQQQLYELTVRIIAGLHDDHTYVRTLKPRVILNHVDLRYNTQLYREHSTYMHVCDISRWEMRGHRVPLIQFDLIMVGLSERNTEWTLPRWRENKFFWFSEVFRT